MSLRQLVHACSTAALILACGALPVRAEQTPPELARQLTTLLPAVVTIQTIASTPQGRMYFDGSGFIIDPAGVIVTNRHVIAGAYVITATIPAIGKVSAKAIYISGAIDLALLKVDVSQKLPALRLGDSRTVKIGDEVLLLGNPLGVGLSVSHGVISALNRDIGDGLYDHFFQTDGALNHGNSGGPMVNTAGEVIAIDTALISSPGNTGSVGIGFAMPINDAKFVIDQYLRSGRVVAGTVGVQAQRVTDELATAFRLKHAQGLIVTYVDPKGPAGGLVKFGDIVLRVNGRDASDVREVGRVVATTPTGQILRVDLLRHGVEQTVDVPVRDEPTDPLSAAKFLGHAQMDASPFATPSDPGMTFGPITKEVQRNLGLDDSTKGAAVTAVAPNSAAAKHNILVGDVILAVGGEVVEGPPDVTRRLQALAAEHLDFAALLVRSSRGPSWVALPLESDH